MGVQTSRRNYYRIKGILGIPVDEPIFIIRAQDDTSPATLSDYLVNAKYQGTTKEFQSDITDIAMDFASWRSKNEDKCKTPD